MVKKRHTAERIMAKLREAEVFLSKSLRMSEVCREPGATERTYYRWRKEYGGVRTDRAKRFKELEWENVRLKKVVAELALDNAILKEAVYPNFQTRHASARRSSVSGRSCPGWRSVVRVGCAIRPDRHGASGRRCAMTSRDCFDESSSRRVSMLGTESGGSRRCYGERVVR